MLKVKKALAVLCTAILAITLAGCSFCKDIHQKIHDKFYMMKDYTAECTLTVVSQKNKTDYDFVCNYKSTDNSYEVIYDDISVNILKDSAKITKGNAVLDIPVKNEDMLIFINTFFKNYYEGEESVQKTSGTENAGSTLLECSINSPSQGADKMKLWIDNKSVTPKRMQVLNGDKVTIEVDFKKFEFTKQ